MFRRLSDGSGGLLKVFSILGMEYDLLCFHFILNKGRKPHSRHLKPQALSMLVNVNCIKRAYFGPK